MASVISRNQSAIRMERNLDSLCIGKSTLAPRQFCSPLRNRKWNQDLRNQSRRAGVDVSVSRNGDEQEN